MKKGYSGGGHRGGGKVGSFPRKGTRLALDGNFGFNSRGEGIFKNREVIGDVPPSETTGGGMVCLSILGTLEEVKAVSEGKKEGGPRKTARR